MLDAVLDRIFPISPQVFVGVIVGVVVVHAILGTIPLLIYFERKISAYIQDRIGPNRVGFDLGLPLLQKLFRGFGFWGLGQSLADGLKFVLKEDFTPRGADKFLFTLAPAAAVVPALIGWAVIPWGGAMEIGSISLGGRELVSAGSVQVMAANINAGFVYLLAIAAIGVYGVTLGGWASNNKFSFLGGMRASAGMISYEIPMGLSILAVLLLTGTIIPGEIVRQQADGVWFVVAQPLAALLMYTCILAECNRAPFDNCEAEQELVGGFHTEYSAMRFALFFLAEYAHMITGSAFFILLFLGGYHLPGVALTSPEETGLLAAIVKFVVFFTKVVLSICFMMVVRWTIPRIRYDQVLRLAWRALIPVSMILVVLTSVMVYMAMTKWWQLAAANVALGVVLMMIWPKTDRMKINAKVALAGSRFNPLPGECVVTGPRGMVARSDDPMPDKSQGLVSVH
ncbi:MAG: complex I subunit 1/NuoH family protein [Phycisphaerales bacterium]